MRYGYGIDVSGMLLLVTWRNYFQVSLQTLMSLVSNVMFVNLQKSIVLRFH